MKLESAIQTEIKDKLQKCGYYVYKHPPFPPGIPDLHAIKDGKHYWFEVKRSEADFKKDFKNKALQALRRKQLREAGDTACVVWEWEQVKDVLDEKKIPKSRR